MPDRVHMFSRSESQSASEKNSRDADIRSHGEQSCENPRRLEFYFYTDPENDQAYRASLEMIWIVTRLVGLDGRRPRFMNLDT